MHNYTYEHCNMHMNSITLSTKKIIPMMTVDRTSVFTKASQIPLTCYIDLITQTCCSCAKGILQLLHYVVAPVGVATPTCSNSISKFSTLWNCIGRSGISWQAVDCVEYFRVYVEMYGTESTWGRTGGLKIENNREVIQFRLSLILWEYHHHRQTHWRSPNA